MIDKETYEREITRMFDSVRTNSKGEHTCSGVKCEDCPFYSMGVCHSYGAANAYNVYEEAIKCIDYVERWSREHPQKHKVSQLEYDILKLYSDNYFYYFYESELLMLLLKKGCFKGATSKTNISNYLNNCEVKEDV